ncbi:MAG: hypothetical protein QM736_13635 [Vicinamibacterales bacterium]
MIRTPLVLLIALLLCAVPVTTQMKIGGPAGDFVELDVVVLDKKGLPMHGLQQSDFIVKDGGKPVTLATFREVTGPDPRDPDSARTVVLLLDDTGIASTGTQSVQIIAKAFLDSVDQHDDVPVVRLHARDDEPYGDRIAGEERIRAYRGGAWPFAYWTTAAEVLGRVVDLSQAVALNPAKRKVIVCVGAGFICNIGEPQSSSPLQFDRAWNAAVHEAALANVAFYGLIPGRTGFRIGALPDVTGGEAISLGSNVGPAIDRILRDSSNYYVIGYWPVVEEKAPQRIEVKTRAKGARVLARKLR